MIRSTATLLLSALTVLALVPFAYSEYTVSQLTENSYDDRLPLINADGDVVWSGNGGSGTDFEVFLYDGSSITQLTDNSYDDTAYGINDNGYVVWYGWDGTDFEIFLYNGSSTDQVTDNSYDDIGYGMDVIPHAINSNGYIVWQGCDGGSSGSCEGGDWEIFLYDGSAITQLTDNSYDDDYPQINENGHVAWQGCAGGGDCPATYIGDGWEIFLYDGSTTVRLTDNASYDGHPQISANGDVVWQGWDGADNEIFLYNGSTTEPLTDNSSNDIDPQINAAGHVVWVGDREIFLYDGSATTQLTDNTYEDNNPQIGDSGHVVWHGRGGTEELDMEIFLYDGRTTTRITNNLHHYDAYPRTNANGDVVWFGAAFTWPDLIWEDFEIYLARPSGPPVTDWAAASTAGAESPSASATVNCLFFLIISVSTVLLWKGWRRPKKESCRFGCPRGKRVGPS